MEEALNLSSDRLLGDDDDDDDDVQFSLPTSLCRNWDSVLGIATRFILEGFGV